MIHHLMKIVKTIVQFQQKSILLFLLFSSIDQMEQKPSDQLELVDVQLVNNSFITIPRYATVHNFTGRVMKGYHREVVLASKQLASALNKAQLVAEKLGYNLVVYDCYRPDQAVQGYLEWIEEEQDLKTKQLYYPNFDKTALVEQDYLATKCPHSRGGATDVSIIRKGKSIIELKDMKQKKIEVGNTSRQISYLDDGTQFMGTHFDFFDPTSHWDSQEISKKAISNRDILKKIMNEAGFQQYEKQWWHFQLINEPFPQTYFSIEIQ